MGIAAAGGFMLLKAWRRRKGRHELDTTADDEPAPVSRQSSEPTKPQEVDDIIRYPTRDETLARGQTDRRLCVAVYRCGPVRSRSDLRKPLMIRSDTLAPARESPG
jgi:hypothetical protein